MCRGAVVEDPDVGGKESETLVEVWFVVEPVEVVVGIDNDDPAVEVFELGKLARFCFSSIKDLASSPLAM